MITRSRCFKIHSTTKHILDVVLADSYGTILSFAIIIMLDGLGLGIAISFLLFFFKRFKKKQLSVYGFVWWHFFHYMSRCSFEQIDVVIFHSNSLCIVCLRLSFKIVALCCFSLLVFFLEIKIHLKKKRSVLVSLCVCSEIMLQCSFCIFIIILGLFI